MWIIFAFGSALFAALVTIAGKIGLKDVDSTLATTIRAVIMAGFLVITALALSKFEGLSMQSLSSKAWLFITLSGIAGALSWLCYFWALKHGPTAAVSAIDRMSLVLVLFLAAGVLGEALKGKAIIGAVLMVLGAVLITLP